MSRAAPIVLAQSDEVRPLSTTQANAFGSAWGTDLSGESYSRLEMEFGIPVELIDWHFVYGREE